MESWKIVPRDRRDILGEGISWSARRECLYWVDIIGQSLYRLRIADGAISEWRFAEPIGWALERAGRDDFIVGLRSGFAELSLEPFSVSPIGDPEPDRPDNRLNDAKTDHVGRIWAGSKNDLETGAEPTGALYRLDHDLTWSRQVDGFQITNGPAFSPDGRTLYHCDTIEKLVEAFDLSPLGTLSNRRIFASFSEGDGYPDGITTDAEGGVWVAHWGGGRVSRFRPDGRLHSAIPLPTPLVTNCAFAGPDLDRLFVTTASIGQGDDPFAGALFEVSPGVRGVEATPFRG